jgi:hypothetical protein
MEKYLLAFAHGKENRRETDRRFTPVEIFRT